jgi:hypothetical protein
MGDAGEWVSLVPRTGAMCVVASVQPVCSVFSADLCGRVVPGPPCRVFCCDAAECSCNGMAAGDGGHVRFLQWGANACGRPVRPVFPPPPADLHEIFHAAAARRSACSAASNGCVLSCLRCARAMQWMWMGRRARSADRWFTVALQPNAALAVTVSRIVMHHPRRRSHNGQPRHMLLFLRIPRLCFWH